jgi:hypothetical protein
LNSCRKRERSARACGPAFFFALLLLVGCATVPAPSDVPTTPAKIWQGTDIFGALVQRAEQFHSMRALARMDYSGPDGRQGFQEAIHVQRPDQLRLETLSMLGAILIVTADGKEMIVYQPREGLFLRGATTKRNLLRSTKIPLELGEITKLLVGLPAVDTTQPWVQEGSALVFSAEDRKKDLVAFESDQAVPTRWERYDNLGRVELSAVFSDYRPTPQGLFPWRILLEAPQQRRKLEMRFEEPELNVSFSPDLFTQRKPIHAQELPIEAIGS